MCGRFVIDATWEELREWYNLINTTALNLRPSYNVTPTQKILICANADGPGTLSVSTARWGLIPVWWKKPLKDLPSTINARGETVAEKPMFRSAFKHRRCLIPVSGFYEWLRTDDGKQPFYISMREDPFMTMAGIYEEWTNPETGEILTTTAIITTAANKWMKKIHHRMPVLLQASEFDPWIEEGDTSFLKACPESWLQAWPVSKDVNSPRNNRRENLDPFIPDGEIQKSGSTDMPDLFS